MSAHLLHFIHTPEFDDCLVEIPVGDEALAEVQESLQENPESGRRIPGTGGVRKLRAPAKGKGKRGGVRVLYYYVIARRTIYLLLAYDKSETDTISEEGKKVLRKLTKQLDAETK